MTYSNLGNDIQTGQPVELYKASRLQGTYFIGATGVGKSGLFEELIMQDIKQGIGVCVLDPHGDLIDKIIARLRKGDLDRVILLDALDKTHTFGINPYQCDDPTDDTLVTETHERVEHIYKLLWPDIDDKPLVKQGIRNSAFTLIDSSPVYSCTMLELPMLFRDDIPRANMVAHLLDDTIRDGYWRDFQRASPTRQAELADMVVNKIEDYTTNRLLRRIIGQSRSTVNFREVMESDPGKIVLVKLPGDNERMTELLGSLLIAQLVHAAFSRKEKKVDQRKQYHIYADEFQQFASRDFTRLLTECRKYGIGTTIAHQARDFLDVLNRAATLQVGNIIVFRVSPEDAPVLARLFKAELQPAEPEYKPIMQYVDTSYIRTVVRWNPPEAADEYMQMREQARVAGLKALVFLFGCLVQGGWEGMYYCEGLSLMSHLHSDQTLPNGWEYDVWEELVGRRNGFEGRRPSSTGSVVEATLRMVGASLCWIAELEKDEGKLLNQFYFHFTPLFTSVEARRVLPPRFHDANYNPPAFEKAQVYSLSGVPSPAGIRLAFLVGDTPYLQSEKHLQAIQTIPDVYERDLFNWDNRASTPSQKDYLYSLKHRLYSGFDQSPYANEAEEIDFLRGFARMQLQGLHDALAQDATSHLYTFQPFPQATDNQQKLLPYLGGELREFLELDQVGFEVFKREEANWRQSYRESRKRLLANYRRSLDPFWANLEKYDPRTEKEKENDYINSLREPREIRERRLQFRYPYWVADTAGYWYLKPLLTVKKWFVEQLTQCKDELEKLVALKTRLLTSHASLEDELVEQGYYRPTYAYERKITRGVSKGYTPGHTFPSYGESYSFSDERTQRYKEVPGQEEQYANAWNRIADELVSLDDYRAKVRIKDKDGKLVEHTIETLKPEKGISGKALDDRKADIRDLMIAHGYWRAKTEVDEEISARHARLRQPPKHPPSPPRRKKVE